MHPHDLDAIVADVVTDWWTRDFTINQLAKRVEMISAITVLNGQTVTTVDVWRIIQRTQPVTTYLGMVWKRTDTTCTVRVGILDSDTIVDKMVHIEEPAPPGQSNLRVQLTERTTPSGQIIGILLGEAVQDDLDFLLHE